MIFTERKITISNNASSIDKQIVLYRGDKNVEIRFTISEFPFKYSRNNETNVIESTEASFGQLVIKVPNDKAPIFSDIVPTKKGSVVFTITGEMIDEISELGTYDFQIRLFDEEQNSRATIPPIEKGIEIREPIATEDVTDTNEVDIATVGYALTTAGTNEDAFDLDGNYNKTNWGNGDRITAAKLNKIEAGIDGVNQKVASGGTGGQGMTEEQAQQLSTAYQHSQTAHVQSSDIPTKTSQLNNDSNFVNETYVTNAINNAQLGGGGAEVDLSIYQTKTDNTLNTTDKTVVGAINEINETMVIVEEQTGDITVGEVPVGGSNVAKDISITDTANNFASTNVEDALAEVGSQIKVIANEVNDLKENGTGTIPNNVALLEDVTVDGETEDYIPLMALNGTEYRLTINNLGVPVIKNINGDIVFTCGTGSSEGGGDTPSTPIVPEGSWINGVAYSDFGWAEGYYVDKGNGHLVANSSWSSSEYMNCEGADYIEGWCYSGSYNVFYDASKQFISNFELGSMSGFKNTCTAIPTNASYFRISNENSKLSNVTITPYKKIDATWTDGVPYNLELIADKYYSSGKLTDYTGWSATNCINCSYASKLSILSPNGTISGSYCSFFDINKKAIGGMTNIAQTTDGTPVEITVPFNACYFGLSADTTTMTGLTVTPIA